LTPAELRAALSATASDDAVILVIQSCAARLRAPDDHDRIGLAAELLPLVRHPSSRVRRAIADACDAFPGDLFDQAHDILAADDDHYVCAAARRAADRRAETRRIAQKNDQADHLTAELAAEIERRYKKEGLQLARRFARREVEQDLERMSHESTKIDDAIDGALDFIEAELRKPDASLAAIRARTGLLRDRVALQRRFLARAREYARQIRPAFAPENVASLASEAREELVLRLRERAARLDFETDVAASLSMHADRAAVLQALQNLLQNAFEAYENAPGRALVRLDARAVGKTQVELRVIDRGAGMSDERQRALFIPFRTGKTGGTGVGLVIARNAVEEVHGGSIHVSSALGQGTTVTMTFPARQHGVRDRR
jgi:signal transduction histidine kinase